MSSKEKKLAFMHRLFEWRCNPNPNSLLASLLVIPRAIVPLGLYAN